MKKFSVFRTKKGRKCRTLRKRSFCKRRNFRAQGLASLQEAFSDEALSECGEIDILNVFRKSEALRVVANEVLCLKIYKSRKKKKR